MPLLLHYDNNQIINCKNCSSNNMETTRQQKIARLLQKELGDIFLQYARNIQGTLATVTGVTISPDLSIARVRLSV